MKSDPHLEDGHLASKHGGEVGWLLALNHPHLSTGCHQHQRLHLNRSASKSLVKFDCPQGSGALLVLTGVRSQPIVDYVAVLLAIAAKQQELALIKDYY